MNRCMFINMFACLHMHTNYVCDSNVYSFSYSLLGLMFKFHCYTHVTHAHWLIYLEVLLISCSRPTRFLHANTCTHIHHTHTCTHIYRHMLAPTCTHMHTPTPYAPHTQAPHRGIISTRIWCVKGCAYINLYHLAHSYGTT